jgi:predicted ATP-grasp superfamily ATP-dependent carboligase
MPLSQTTKLQDNSMPVVVLGCGLGGLAVMRTLGSQGVPLYGVDKISRPPALLSRYCRGKFIRTLAKDAPERFLNDLLAIGQRLGQPSILIPTSDAFAVFASEYREQLSAHYRYPNIDPTLARTLVSKEGMYGLANKHGVPTALTWFPRSLDDVRALLGEIDLPVMLKGIHGDRLQEKTGKKMVIVRTRDELLRNYELLEDPASPNLLIQELIPGGDDQVFIFNGYFDERSECLAAFTGHKIRQYPIHVGCASLGECRWNDEVAALTKRFMKDIGYRGILDIGYRLDTRDGRYKVLDINPRVGQAFRLFVAENDMDVVRTLYRDLTGQPNHAIRPREGRRWMIEDYDLISTIRYFQEGSLAAGEWLHSFQGLQEGAWFNWKDPVPFLAMAGRRLRQPFRRASG